MIRKKGALCEEKKSDLTAEKRRNGMRGCEKEIGGYEKGGGWTERTRVRGSSVSPRSSGIFTTTDSLE